MTLFSCGGVCRRSVNQLDDGESAVATRVSAVNEEQNQSVGLERLATYWKRNTNRSAETMVVRLGVSVPGRGTEEQMTLTGEERREKQ